MVREVAETSGRGGRRHHTPRARPSHLPRGHQERHRRHATRGAEEGRRVGGAWVEELKKYQAGQGKMSTRWDHSANKTRRSVHHRGGWRKGGQDGVITVEEAKTRDLAGGGGGDAGRPRLPLPANSHRRRAMEVVLENRRLINEKKSRAEGPVPKIEQVASRQAAADHRRGVGARPCHPVGNRRAAPCKCRGQGPGSVTAQGRVEDHRDPTAPGHQRTRHQVEIKLGHLAPPRRSRRQGQRHVEG